MTLRTLAALVRVTVEFFWGEAAWGLTAALRQLRWLRLAALLSCVVALSLVMWAVVDNSAKAFKDSYSDFEGRLLEEKVREMNEKVISHRDDIKTMKEDIKTAALLAVQMQGQISYLTRVADNARTVLVGVVVAVVGSLLKDIIGIKFRGSSRSALFIRRKKEVVYDSDKDKTGP